MKFESLKDFYIHELQDLYDAETRLIDVLPKMIDRSSSPDLRKVFENHLDETRTHQQRLEQICSNLGADPRGNPCEAAQGLVKEAQEVISADGDENVIDAALIAVGNRMQHYEMAGYGAARAHARTLGFDDQAAQLQSNLDEEGQTDKRLTELAMKVNPQTVGA